MPSHVPEIGWEWIISPNKTLTKSPCQPRWSKVYRCLCSSCKPILGPPSSCLSPVLFRWEDKYHPQIYSKPFQGQVTKVHLNSCALLSQLQGLRSILSRSCSALEEKTTIKSASGFAIHSGTYTWWSSNCRHRSYNSWNKSTPVSSLDFQFHQNSPILHQELSGWTPCCWYLLPGHF